LLSHHSAGTIHSPVSVRVGGLLFLILFIFLLVLMVILRLTFVLVLLFPLAIRSLLRLEL
jgi:hypothetical protein